MPTIKISSIKHGTGNASLNYGFGKNNLKNNVKKWLKDNNVNKNIVDHLSDRAIVKGGNNLINPSSLNNTRWEFHNTKTLYHQNKSNKSRDGKRFIQSFDTNELSPLKPHDWYKCNAMGVELAKKIAPNNECAVYTQLDGKGHKLHNHLILGSINLKTGKQYHDFYDFKHVADLNDEVAIKNNIKPLSKAPREQYNRKTIAERNIINKHQYSWKQDIRNRIDSIMNNKNVQNYDDFLHQLKMNKINFHDRGNSSSYSFLDKDQKHRRIRGTRLGHSYQKEVIFNELGKRELQQSENFKQEQQSSSNAINNITETDNQKSQQNYQHEKSSYKNDEKAFRRFGRNQRFIQKRVTQLKQSNQNFKSRNRRLVPRMEYVVRDIDNKKNRKRVNHLENFIDSVEKTLQSLDQQIQSTLNQANYAMNEHIRHEKVLEQQEAQDEAQKQAKQDQLAKEKQYKINQYYHFNGPSW